MVMTANPHPHPQLYFPLVFVFTKTGVVIRKPLCGLLGVDGPSWSRKHLRIIDWKMILMCFNNARLRFTKQPFVEQRSSGAAEPVGKYSLWHQTG